VGGAALLTHAGNGARRPRAARRQRERV